MLLFESLRLVYAAAQQVYPPISLSQFEIEKSANADMFKATQMVIGTAYEDATAHRPDEKTGTRTLRYSQGYMDVVNLAMSPTGDMTWETWTFALLGIGSFFQRWEYVELSFDVEVPELGRVGTGMVFQD